VKYFWENVGYYQMNFKIRKVKQTFTISGKVKFNISNKIGKIEY